MKYLFTAFCGCNRRLGFGRFSQADSGNIWYVNQASKSAGDGHAWKAPFQSLQEALSAASKGDEIWVARGTYYPDAADQTKSFVLKEDVAVYGGFSGTKRRGSKGIFERT